MLICTFEKFDDFPIFVIETRTGKSTNFGQLPLEILWVIKFLLDRAAIISVFLCLITIGNRLWYKVKCKSRESGSENTANV